MGRHAVRSLGTKRGRWLTYMAEAEVEEELVKELAPEEEALLPGPVQQYLQEIGAIHLLTAKQEVELAKEVENGRLLARLQRELTAQGQPLSYDSLTRHLLACLRKLLDRVRPVLGEEGGTYADLLFSPAFQRSIEAEIDLSLAEAIADVVGTSGRQVADDLWVPASG